MSDTVTTPAEAKRFARVELDNPLKRGETEITSVTLRKPMGGDLRGIQLADLVNLDVIAVSKVLPRISDPMIHSAEFMTMDIEDITAIAGEIASFLPQRKHKAAAGLDQ